MHVFNKIQCYSKWNRLKSRVRAEEGSSRVRMKLNVSQGEDNYEGSEVSVANVKQKSANSVDEPLFSKHNVNNDKIFSDKNNKNRKLIDKGSADTSCKTVCGDSPLR